jgi:CRISPR type III-A-associated RAMP protein Csm5
LNHNWKEYELKNKRGKFSDKNIQSRIFGNDPNHDFMRFLKIGDALFEPDSLLAMSVLSMNYLFDRTKRDEKFLLLTEAIAADEEASIRLKLDIDHWQKNIDANEIRQSIPEFMHDYESLFEAINSFTKDLVEGEIEFWEEDKNLNVVENYLDELENILNAIKNCSSKETVLRLGHGSGWIFMTGGWIKNEDLIDKPLYYKIEDNTRPRNHLYKKDYFFPKTRRMDEDGELMGFIKLSLEN